MESSTEDRIEQASRSPDRAGRLPPEIEPAAAGWRGRLERCIMRHPAASLAAALAAGISLGWWIKRR